MTAAPRKALSLRLEPAVWAAVTELAKANDRSLNYTVTWLIEEALKETKRNAS